MKTNLSSPLLAAVSMAAVASLSAREGPEDFGPEPSLQEQQSQRSDFIDQLMRDLPDKTLLDEPPSTDEDWDMVRRLEKLMQDRSTRAMAERLIQDARTGPRGPEDRDVVDLPPWIIGLSVEPVDPFIRTHLSIPEDTGVKVTAVMEGAPAADAGVMVNDILLAANETKVTSLESLKEAVVEAGREGEPLRLELIRTGERTTVVVEPRKREAAAPPPVPAEPRGNPQAGRRLREMNRRLDQQQRQIEELRRQIEELRDRDR